MKIKELFVEKLYWKYDFNWTFDDRVNILAGRNGSYKSTLLSIIAHICRAEHVDNELRSNFHNAIPVELKAAIDMTKAKNACAALNIDASNA